MPEKVNHNPDILSCLANLSSDEVFTPPEIANAMLDLLPQELFTSPNTKFLDPGCKSGVFLREIAKRLNDGLMDLIPDVEQRMDHIMKKQLFAIAITQITGLISRRSVYCTKDASSRFSVAKFTDSDGNIRYRRFDHKWEGFGKKEDQKCLICGAPRKQFDRGDGMETHAYEFIHMDKATEEELKEMNFDVVIGNPPYQLNDGGNAASAQPLYHFFVQQALKLNPRYLSMIIPARWYAGGKGLDQFRGIMLDNSSISQLVDIPNSSDCFPGVNIAGGICYFLWERNYNSYCNVANMSKGIISSATKRKLNEFDFFVRNNKALPILRKILSHNEKLLNEVVFSRNYFCLPTTVSGLEKEKPNTIKVLTSNGTIYVDESKINDKCKQIGNYKVIITYAMSGGNKPSNEGNYQILSSLGILPPFEACTETYLILCTFPTKGEAENMVSYASTKFFRFLLLQALSSIHITKDKFCFVPQQSYNKKWTDWDLYKKYDLTREEVELIEETIKPMDGGSDA